MSSPPTSKLKFMGNIPTIRTEDLFISLLVFHLCEGLFCVRGGNELYKVLDFIPGIDRTILLFLNKKNFVSISFLFQGSCNRDKT